MTNIFFLSFNSISAIKHCKITGKFDNNGKGKIRLATRFLVEIAEECPRDVDLYLFIRNDQKTLKLGELDQEYNRQFNFRRFRSSAGTGTRFQETGAERNDYVQFIIDESFENPTIVEKNVTFPLNIKCSVVKGEEIPDELENCVTEEDILIKITFNKDETSSERLYVFQIVVILENFLPEEEIGGWKVPSKVWSANFNMHETIGYERLFQRIQGHLRYPDILELWVYLPSGHQFVASSPRYEKVFKLEASDIQLRTSKGDEFLSKEGDLAVKLMNKLGKSEKYSIICTSPHMIEEKIENLVEELFEEEKKNFVTWGEFIQPLALLVGLFSLVIGVIVVLAVRSIPISQASGTISPVSLPLAFSPTGISINIETIVAASIFFGISTWAISTTLKSLAKRFSWMSIAAPISMTLLGIAGLISIGYQDAGYVRDLTPWFSFASILIGALYGIPMFSRLIRE